MQLIITNNFKDSADNFVYNYLPNLIYNLVKGELNITRLKEFDEYMNINSREVILYACRNLSITKPSKNVYNISINKNLKYKGKSISS